MQKKQDLITLLSCLIRCDEIMIVIENEITNEVVSKIKYGASVVYPTDTLYGLGVVLKSEFLDKVFEIKGRDFNKPLSIAVASIDDISRYAYISDVSIFDSILPGPYSFLLQKKEIVPDKATAGSPLVSIRVPGNDFTLELLRKTGPLTATSANLSGGASPDNVFDAANQLGSRVEIYLNGGTTEFHDGSTIVDLTSQKILREGAGLIEVSEWMKKYSKNIQKLVK